MSYVPVFEFNSVNRGVANLHAGIYDVSTAVAPSGAILDRFFASDKPLYPILLVAIRRDDTAPLAHVNHVEITSFAALSQNTFPFLDQFVAEHSELKRYDVSTYEQGISLVEKGKMPYFITYGSDQTSFRRAGFTVDIVQKMPVHLIVSKQHPNAKQLMTEINAAL